MTEFLVTAEWGSYQDTIKIKAKNKDVAQLIAYDKGATHIFKVAKC